MKVSMLGLTLALWIGAPALAQTPSRATKAARAEAMSRLEVAEQALDEGRLDEARAAAEEALRLDASALTMGARQILFDVLILRGDLDLATRVLEEYTQAERVDPLQAAWRARAAVRLSFERAERRGDLGAATGALTQLSEAASLGSIEERWLERALWRLELRKQEASTNPAAARQAIDQRLARTGLSAEDSAWLSLARQRIDLRAAELECDGAARWDGQGLAEDRAWALARVARARARAASASGDRAALRAALQTLDASEAPLEADRAWVAEARQASKLMAACSEGDRDEQRTLGPKVEGFLEAEPSCAWGPLRACQEASEVGPRWASAGLRLGVARDSLGGDPQDLQGVSGTVGLDLAGLWTTPLPARVPGDLGIGLRGGGHLDMPYASAIADLRWPTGQIGLGLSLAGRRWQASTGLGLDHLRGVIYRESDNGWDPVPVTRPALSSVTWLDLQGASWSGHVRLDAVRDRVGGELSAEIVRRSGNMQWWLGPSLTGAWWQVGMVELDSNKEWQLSDACDPVIWGVGGALRAGARWGGEG